MFALVQVRPHDIKMGIAHSFLTMAHVIYLLLDQSTHDSSCEVILFPSIDYVYHMMPLSSTRFVLKGEDIYIKMKHFIERC